MMLAWLIVGILALIGGIPLAIYRLIKYKDLWPLLGGIILMVMDYIFETAFILRGQWQYPHSIMHIGVIPIELMMVFFGMGVMGVWMFENIKSNDFLMDFSARTHGSQILALIFIVFLILFLGYNFSMIDQPVELWIIFSLLALIGIVLAKHRVVIIIIATTAMAFDYILESYLVGNGAYDYTYGYNLGIAFIYFLGTIFVGGFIDAALFRKPETERECKAIDGKWNRKTQVCEIGKER